MPAFCDAAGCSNRSAIAIETNAIEGVEPDQVIKVERVK